MAKRRPAGDGMVRKRDDGRWEGRIVIGHRENGEPLFRHVYAKTQKALLDKLHQNIECYRDVELTEDSRMTLGQWLDRWLTEYKAGTMRPSQRPSSRFRTMPSPAGLRFAMHFTSFEFVFFLQHKQLPHFCGNSYQNFGIVRHYIRIENPWYCSYCSSSLSTAYSTVRSILPPRSRIRRISCLL